jgi:flagellar hook protein FlgE
LDLAVDGRGHFVVADGPQRFFSRAGNFKLDDSGFIVTNENMAVLGFPEGGTGALEPINVNSLQQQTNIETRNINLSGNINSNSTPVTLPATPSTAGVVPAVENVTFAQLAQQASFSTVVQTFDTLGSAHNVSLYFYKNAAPGSWTVWAVTNSSDVDPTGTRQGYPRLLGTQTVTFGTNGQKTSPAAGTPDITFTSPWNNNSNPAIPVTLSFNPFTQYAASSNILMINQDGLGIGSVSGINIEKDGRVFALLSNGQTTILGTLALAKFSNDEGLVRLGGNLLQQTLQSGEPVIGRPQAGDLGGIEAGSLELSTVDVASEFVRLISLQRGFQANSRIISTVNQLLGEIVQVV